MRVTLAKTPNGDSELAIFCNQANQVEGLGHQSSHITFELQCVLPAECSGPLAYRIVCHQGDKRGFLQQPMGADGQSYSSGNREEGREGQSEEPEGQGHQENSAHRIN